MSASIPISGADDTLVRPVSTVAPTTKPTDSRRTTVLPRLVWSGPTPVANADHRMRFEELGRLGEGGMGEVVLAKDHDIERTVAIKRLSHATDLGLVMRFVDEIRTVGALEHPNIVPVHDVGIDEDGRYYFVMKHLRGEDLQGIIARLRAGDRPTHDRFPFHVRVQVFLSIVNAMAYAHEQGFVHRDLKPSNVMVGPFGEVTVMDWGLARRTEASTTSDAWDTPTSPTRVGTALETQAGAVMGTPHYMSPEQARGEHATLDPRSDLYSLGVLLHEFLYLEHYLDSRVATDAVLDGVQRVSPSVFGLAHDLRQPAVPAELGWFILKAMDKDPARRFQTAREMIEALQRTVDGRVEVQCPRTFTKRVLQEAVHRADDHPVGVLLGTVAVMALLVGGFVSLLLRLV